MPDTDIDTAQDRQFAAELYAMLTTGDTRAQAAQMVADRYNCSTATARTVLNKLVAQAATAERTGGAA